MQMWRPWGAWRCTSGVLIHITPVGWGQAQGAGGCTACLFLVHHTWTFLTQAFYYCNNKQGDNTLPVHGFFIEGLFDNPISLTIKRPPA